MQGWIKSHDMFICLVHQPKHFLNISLTQHILKYAMLDQTSLYNYQSGTPTKAFFKYQSDTEHYEVCKAGSNLTIYLSVWHTNQTFFKYQSDTAHFEVCNAEPNLTL